MDFAVLFKLSESLKPAERLVHFHKSPAFSRKDFNSMCTKLFFMCLFWLLNKSGSTYLNDNVYMLYNYMDAVCITLKTETQERNTIYHFHELLHGFV